MKIIEFIRSVLGTNDLNKKILDNNRKTLENSKLLHELNWANVFNNSITGCKWLENQSFSPGRWAVGYPLLYILFKTLEFSKPRKIIEFGLGQSTNMLSKYSKAFNEVQTFTLEHDQQWIDFYLSNEKSPDNLKIIKIENTLIEIDDFETLSIGNLKNIVGDEKFELIIVDAPFGSEHFSRPQVISMIPHNIHPNHFCIIIDDFDRPGEKETCNRIEEILFQEGITFKKGIYSGLKDCIIYCSDDIKFLTSL
jgi:hypothetical protein